MAVAVGRVTRVSPWPLGQDSSGIGSLESQQEGSGVACVCLGSPKTLLRSCFSFELLSVG